MLDVTITDVSTTDETQNIKYALLEKAKVIARNYQARSFFDKSTEGKNLTDEILAINRSDQDLSDQGSDQDFEEKFLEMFRRMGWFLHSKIANNSEEYKKSDLFKKIFPLFIEIAISCPDHFKKMNAYNFFRHVAANAFIKLTIQHSKESGIPDIYEQMLNEDNTVLHIAIMEDDLQMIKFLLAFGEVDIDINQQNTKIGRTALHFAVFKGNDDAIKLLMDYGADANIRDKWGISPIEMETRNLEKDPHDRKFLHTRTIFQHRNYRPNSNIDLIILRAIEAKRYDIAKELLTLATQHSVVKKIDIFPGYSSEQDRFLGHTPLQLVSLDGNVEMAQILLENGARLELSDGDKNTPLHLAASSGHVNMIELLMNRGADANAVNLQIRTPLTLALYNGKLAAARSIYHHKNFQYNSTVYPAILPYLHSDKLQFMEWISIVNATTIPQSFIYELSWGYNVFHKVVLQGDVEKVSLLLDRGSDVNKEGIFLDTGTHLITMPEHSSHFSIAYADLHIIMKFAIQMFPLHLAVKKDNVAIVQLLLVRGADPTLRDDKGRTPCELTENPEIKRLFDNYHRPVSPADLQNLKSNFLEDLKTIARAYRSRPFYIKILDSTADAVGLTNRILNFFDSTHPDFNVHFSELLTYIRNVLAIMIQNDDYKKSEFFEKLFPLFIKIITRCPDIFMAINTNDFCRNLVIDLLIKRGRYDSIENCERGGRTLLHIAVFENDISSLELLLIYGVENVNQQDDEGKTPLHFAVMKENWEEILLLIDHGADANSVDKYGKSPIDDGIKYDKILLAKAIIQHKNYRPTSSIYHTILIAFEKKQYDVAKELLALASQHPMENKIDQFADYSFSFQNKGRTALQIVSQDGNVEMARLLLDHGAGIDVPSDSNNTALHVAVYDEHLDIIELLMERGANPNLLNWERHSPLIRALFYGRLTSARSIYQYKKFHAIDDVMLSHDFSSEAKASFFSVGLRSLDLVNNLYWGCNAFHEAVLQGAVAELGALLDKHAQVNKEGIFLDTGSDLMTILEYCSVYSDSNPDLNFIMEHATQISPLHLAVKKDNVAMVKLLLDRGADPTLRDDKGRTPCELTENPEIKKLFNVSPSSSTDRQESEHDLDEFIPDGEDGSVEMIPLRPMI